MMLVLQRLDGQSILIGENIVVKLLRGQKGKSSIGISAPKEIVILRHELQKSNASNAVYFQEKNEMSCQDICVKLSDKFFEKK